VKEVTDTYPAVQHSLTSSMLRTVTSLLRITDTEFEKDASCATGK
jgi:hypothetical protein